jgi:predicted DNA-binding protein with PD1-like motif
MNFLKFLTVVCFALCTTVAMADDKSKNSAAVNKSTCNRLANTTQPFILVLSSGDSLIESITQCAKDAKLMGASVSGVGQLHNPVLAYFSSDPKAKPTLSTFDGFFELASLNGDITNNSGKYYTHLHTTLADKKFHGIAGHVNDAKVGLTAEITIIPLFAPLERTVDPKTGFGLIVN